MQSSRNGTEPTQRAAQRAFCIAALPDGEDLAELGELLRTAGVATVGELIQRREQPHPNTYLGPGKVVEAKAAAAVCDANLIACDDELSARQERNLEEALGLPVVDRTTVILDIFASHANSAEGKLQVELAQLEYNLARMRGLWTHLERLGGGIGTRGPGETQIETDRRLARDRIAALRRRLEHVKGTRAVQRAERERAALPTIALVGYTNAGKSTLLNALTGSEVGVRDRLFHTLDPTTRTLKLGGRTHLLTDTVGFISKLPHQLVDAFGATLEETVRAELLAHVLDASAPEAQQEIMQRSVEATLEEIGAGERPRLLVLNKIDLLDDDAREELRYRHPEAVLVSGGAPHPKGVVGEGLEELRERLEQELAHTLRPLDLLVPYADGGSLAELHELAGEVSREDTAEGVRVRALVPARLAQRFARFAVAPQRA
ncbi:MAG TPA: GTPase HflX [Solirubrobacteraceae bacterium]|jgi:GTP-binding protein HflX|nr:GTPase HflX [Solirubrobacteraceae bacterium]